MPASVLLWLFAHGGVVFPAVVSTVVAAAFARAMVRRRRAAVAHAEARRSQLGARIRHESDLGEGPALVVGRLRADGAADGAAAVSLSYRAGLPGAGADWETMAHVRAERLSLVVGDTVLPIEGAIEVVVGSREGPWRPSKQRSRAMAEALDPWAPRLDKLAISERTLRPGDRVWARGTLEQGAEVTRGSYRDRGASLRFAAGEPVSLAFAGVPRALGARGPLTYLAHALAAGIAVTAAFGLAGEIALHELRAHIDMNQRLAELPVPETRRFAAIAALSPFHRDTVLRELSIAIETSAVESDETQALLWALRWGRGLSPTPAHAGRRHTEDASTSPEALYAAGHFQRASLALEALGPDAAAGRCPHDESICSVAGHRTNRIERERFGVRVHLLAGRAEPAAAAARRLAEAVRGPWYTKTDIVHDEERARRALCLAEAIEARTGSAAARSSLEKVASEPALRLCAVLFADLLQGAARVAFADAINRRLKEPDSWLELLATEAGPERPRVPHSAALAEPGRLAADPGAVLRDALPAVEMAIAYVLSTKPVASPPAALAVTRASADAAVIAAIGGDADAARRHADAMRDAAPAITDVFGTFEARGAAELDAVLALLAGDVQSFDLHAPPERSAVVSALIAAHLRDDPQPLVASADLFNAGTSQNAREALAGAERDGIVLVERLLHPPSSFMNDWDEAAESLRMLRLLAPGLRRHTRELKHWLHAERHPTLWPVSPLRRMIAWNDLAAGADAVHAPELSASFRASARVFLEALTKRQWAVPLAVLERI